MPKWRKLRFKTYRHRYLIIGTVLITIVMLIIGQTLIERVFVYAIPIGVFITIVGGTYFLYLIVRSSKHAL